MRARYASAIFRYLDDGPLHGSPIRARQFFPHIRREGGQWALEFIDGPLEMRRGDEALVLVYLMWAAQTDYGLQENETCELVYGKRPIGSLRIVRLFPERPAAG